MKKHLGLLLLFVVQNVCAMELDPLAITLKYDEKCKLVAKYVYKYPQGKNDIEAYLIQRFLNDTRLKRSALSRSVNRYKNMLHNMDAEEILDNMHEKYFYTLDNEESPIYQSIPNEIKQKIFTQVLWDYAAQYYAMYYTCKFVCIEPRLIPFCCHGWPSQYYMPYFLAEVQERDDRYLFFSTTKLDSDFEMSEHNDSRVRRSDFDNDNNSYRYKDSEVTMFCCTQSPFCSNKLFSMLFESTVGKLRDLVWLLETKKLRVLSLKATFNENVEKIARQEDKEGINAFIQLLTLYKQMPRDIASMYETELPQSIPIMLKDLPSMYEREMNRNYIKKPTISGLQHLS